MNILEHEILSKAIEMGSSFVYILFMIFGYKVLDKTVLKRFETWEELKNNNLAVAIVVAGFFIGIALLLQKSI